jgi:hypothetical protein
MRTGGTLLALAAVGGGCSTLQTRWEYDHSADFGSLRTYEWIGVRAARNEVIANRVREETDRILVAHGLRAGGASPDFTIVVYFDPEARPPDPEAAVREPTGLGYFVGCLLAVVCRGTVSPNLRGGGPSGALSGDTQTLRLEFVDPRTQQVIWRGCAKGPFYAPISEQRQVGLVDRSVAELLLRFPPAR